ncbi:MAG: hypothetical protein ABMA64_07150 [Myxococcota bacterium]
MVLTWLAAAALAGPDATRDALDRLEEVLELRLEDGRLSRDDVLPAIVVQARPRYEETAPWFATRSLEVLQQAFGEGNLRLCEACMAPRGFVGGGELVYQTGPIGLDEVTRLDDGARGPAPAARSAVWIEEYAGGVSVRIVDLRTARVLFAQNIDPLLIENANSQRMYTLSEELERRARGDSLTQAFVDLVVYPGQHVSLDWTEQWGPTNANLSGITLSLVDPVVGVGAVHYRRVDVLDTLVGAKLIVSVPTALVRIVDDGDVIDPLLTGVALVRVPFGRSNYGAVASVSTNGAIGIGVSLLNIRLVPVIP